MPNRPPIATAASQPAFRVTRGARAAALAEVACVFALTHVVYRSFKHFTALGHAEVTAGLNYSAGSTMIIISTAALLVTGRRFADYGVTWRDWRFHLTLGLLCSVVLAAGAGLVVLLTPVPAAAFHRVGPATALAGGAGELLATVLLLLLLRRERPFLRRCPLWLTLILLITLFALPILLAWLYHQSALAMLAAVGWLFVGAGFGEEMLFRGYIQSRVNQAFGRPFHFLGAQFGVGLIVSALLFGVIHVLNRVDYFAWRFEPDWWSGFGNCFAGLFFRFLRERTGSILPGAVVHGLYDTLTEIGRITGMEP